MGSSQAGQTTVTQVIPQTTSQLQLLSTSELESLSTSEPESDSTLHPVAESTSEPRSESSAEPELESTSEPESESISEPESTSEPESESTAIPESESISEPESTSEPESESTVIPESESISEPESTSEPESESASEPESESISEPESTSEPESESTAVPESESMSEPESDSTTEPDSENTTEPETESATEPESESTLEPESEISSEPESESASEPESETATEPESASPTEAESESTSEPESETTSEPEAESLSEAEVDSESEYTSDSESESDSEQTSESESDVTTEPESDTEAESGATEGVPEQRPTNVEIVVPPVFLIVLIILALFVLLLRSRRASINKSLFGVSKNFIDSIMIKKRVNVSPFIQHPLKVIDLTEMDCESTKPAVPEVDSHEPFFNDFDLEVLVSLRNCYNQPKELIRIAIPAVLSLALCPLTLYLFDPFRKFVWPDDQYPDKPDINDAIACYLSPAGLVYATSFGFAFQQVLNKQHEIMTKMTEEISMLDQIATFTVKLQLGLCTKLKILRAIKTECIFMVLQVLDRDIPSYKYSPTDDIKVKIWDVVDLLREVDTSRKNHVDRVLSERILSHIMKLNSICSDRMGVLHTRIHPIKWIFLETLGFFSFLGILLLTAHSYRMELVMCIVTVFSISMLCYVVSDLDSPFSGFFRVDIGVLEEVLKRLDMIYEMARRHGDVHVFYPD